jgi:hypothetical protein
MPNHSMPAPLSLNESKTVATEGWSATESSFAPRARERQHFFLFTGMIDMESQSEIEPQQISPNEALLLCLLRTCESHNWSAPFFGMRPAFW